MPHFPLIATPKPETILNPGHSHNPDIKNLHIPHTLTIHVFYYGSWTTQGEKIKLNAVVHYDVNLPSITSFLHLPSKSSCRENYSYFEQTYLVLEN